MAARERREGTISAGMNQGQGEAPSHPDQACAASGQMHPFRPTLARMEVLLLTNDPVRLSFLTCLLRDAGIATIVLDSQASAVDGIIGAIPRRLMVAGDQASRARRVLAEAGEL